MNTECKILTSKNIRKPGKTTSSSASDRTVGVPSSAPNVLLGASDALKLGLAEAQRRKDVKKLGVVVDYWITGLFSCCFFIILEVMSFNCIFKETIC